MWPYLGPRNPRRGSVAITKWQEQGARGREEAAFQGKQPLGHTHEIPKHLLGALRDGGNLIKE